MNPKSEASPAFLARAGARDIAYRFRAGRGVTILFLPGYMSDMQGGKAQALDGWAGDTGRAMVRMDYGGNGESRGRFEDGTLASWRDDVLAVIDRVVEGQVVLVGSSMGGWLALLVALARPDRVAGLIGIAAAPDFTDWGFTDAEKAVLATEGRIAEPSEYGGDRVTTRAFWESGQALRMLDAPIDIDCPVRLIHGQQDDVVPWHVALRIVERVRSDDVQATLVKDGDHRLSRDADIALLIRTTAALLETL